MSTEMTCLKCGAKKSGSVGEVLEWDEAHNALCAGVEKALAPTGDERELVYTSYDVSIANEVQARLGRGVMPSTVAAVREAVFRRSEVPEPQGEPIPYRTDEGVVVAVDLDGTVHREQGEGGVA